MNKLTPQEPLADGRATWTIEDYRGHQMHVCTELRTSESRRLSGYGHQWAFTVKITGRDAGRTADQDAGARSDPKFFYSTRAIAESMGFVKGRELIDGR